MNAQQNRRRMKTNDKKKSKKKILPKIALTTKRYCRWRFYVTKKEK